MRQIGLEAGLAYQILDDILDETSTTGELGKEVGSDAARCKPTAVSLYGLEGAKSRLHNLKSSLQKKIDPLPTPLKDLLQRLVERKK